MGAAQSRPASMSAAHGQVLCPGDTELCHLDTRTRELTNDSCYFYMNCTHATRPHRGPRPPPDKGHLARRTSGFSGFGARGTRPRFYSSASGPPHPHCHSRPARHSTAPRSASWSRWRWRAHSAQARTHAYSAQKREEYMCHGSCVPTKKNVTRSHREVETNLSW